MRSIEESGDNVARVVGAFVADDNSNFFSGYQSTNLTA
jgi:hypothetical protein